MAPEVQDQVERLLAGSEDMSPRVGDPDAPHRFDPYRNFNVRVKWDGRYVAGFSNVSGLDTAVAHQREGGGPDISRHVPGHSKFELITLERGVTHDRDFLSWASQASPLQPSANTEVALAEVRKDIAIELHNEAGQLLMTYRVCRCWVSELRGPGLDAKSNAVPIELITLQHEGWERDMSVADPQESSGSHD